jgi:hypothetical protein
MAAMRGGVHAQTPAGRVPILGARVRTPEDGEGMVTAVYYTRLHPEGRIMVTLDIPIRTGTFSWEREYEPQELVKI